MKITQIMRGLLVHIQVVQVVQIEIINRCRKPNDEPKDRTNAELFVSESLKRSLKFDELVKSQN